MVMAALRFRPPAKGAIIVDAGQATPQSVIVYDGPIESILGQTVGALEDGTRLYGRVWTGRRHVIIRYYTAQLPNGEKFPICAVARMGGEPLRAKRGPYPGSAELEDPVGWVLAVEEFL